MEHYAQIRCPFFITLARQGIFLLVVREITLMKNVSKGIILESNRECAKDLLAG